jgi:ribosomal protein L40E
VQFEQPAQERLIEDEAELAQAKAGPDIHCYYCGSRNPAGAEKCSQCGAPLTEGTARASGQVLGAHRDKPAEKIACPACGAENEPDAAKCAQCGASLVQPKLPEPPPVAAKAAPPARSRSRLVGIVVGVVLALLVCAGCATFFVLSNRTEDTSAQVQGCSWNREITIEALVPVADEGWRDGIPAGADIGQCAEKVHHTEERPTGQTREVCGTPYTVDSGSGYGQVAQDCEPEEITEEVEIYADWCDYSVDEWQVVDSATLSGDDANPRWPEVQLQADQREGERDESYRFSFRAEGGSYSYETDNADLYARCRPGDRWVLKVNTFNAVTGIEPVQ